MIENISTNAETAKVAAIVTANSAAVATSFFSEVEVCLRIALMVVTGIISLFHLRKKKPDVPKK